MDTKESKCLQCDSEVELKVNEWVLNFVKERLRAELGVLNNNLLHRPYSDGQREILERKYAGLENRLKNLDNEKDNEKLVNLAISIVQKEIVPLEMNLDTRPYSKGQRMHLTNRLAKLKKNLEKFESFKHSEIWKFCSKDCYLDFYDLVHCDNCAKEIKRSVAVKYEVDPNICSDKCYREYFGVEQCSACKRFYDKADDVDGYCSKDCYEWANDGKEKANKQVNENEFYEKIYRKTEARLGDAGIDKLATRIVSVHPTHLDKYHAKFGHRLYHYKVGTIIKGNKLTVNITPYYVWLEDEKGNRKVLHDALTSNGKLEDFDKYKKTIHPFFGVCRAIFDMRKSLSEYKVPIE